jgi:hypothetical protein
MISGGVTSMSAARAYIVVMLLLAGTLQASGGQDTGAVSPDQAVTAATDAAMTQIRVYRTALTEGRDEPTRVDGAKCLLFSDNPNARKEILQILRDGSNPSAQTAICLALVGARDERKPVTNKGDFVDPLMSLLRTETNPARAELVAQTMLIFPYDDIQRELERMADDPNAPKVAVSNAIRAMEYQPDEDALRKLFSLAGRTDTGVAGEAREALTLIGVEVPADPNAIPALIERLQRRGPPDFINNPKIMRIWLLSADAQLVEERRERKNLEQRYLDVIEKLYGSQTEEKKTDYLSQQLTSEETSVKLWALDKLSELQRGTGRTKLSEQLKTIALGMISHPDKRVRLKTANLLGSMWEVNSAQQLLDRYQAEDDAEVRQAIFLTLGTVCYNQLKPAAQPAKPLDEIRRKTLDIAMVFLNSAEVERVRAGAGVISKLLEQDGLRPEEVYRYLRALSDRYRQAGANINRSELLSPMASLCGQQSVCRTEAARLYGPIFEAAMADTADSMRLAAMEGLISVNKVDALRKFRKDIWKDASQAVRIKLMDLYGEVGTSDDLDSLFLRLGQNGESEAAWKAMYKILGRCSAEVLDAWMARLDPKTNPNALSVDQRLSFLLLVEQKATSDKDASRLKVARERIFSLYASGNNAGKATEYVKLLLNSAATDTEKQATTTALASVCLTPPSLNLDLAVSLIEKYLDDRDLDAESSLAKSISAYMSEPPVGADPNVLLDRLRLIKVKDSTARGVWQQQMVQWSLAKTKKSAEIQKAGN